MSIGKTKLTVGLKGAEPIMDGELYASVKPDDCYWNIADGKVLELILQKVMAHVAQHTVGWSHVAGVCC